MENILLTIHLIIAVVLVAVILVQKSEGGALGIGGGGGGQFGIFTARGSASFLTRTTAILATCFIATSLLLTVIGRTGNSEEELLLQQLDANETLLTTPLIEESLEEPAADSEATPAVPLAE